MKVLVRKILNFLHLDLTKNLEYDRLTLKILKSVLKKDSNCIDVGCHKGEILDLIIACSPNGNHFAFEPIPSFYKTLNSKYSSKAKIFPFALANENGETSFNYVKNAPAYSGIKPRKYKVVNPDIEKIKVELKKLDDVIPKDIKIDFIKIDVEGAEFGVLKGGMNLIGQNKPVVVFEFGMGASDFYKTSSNDIFEFFSNLDMKISTLKMFLDNKKSLDKQRFETIFKDESVYYFIAWS